MLCTFKNYLEYFHREELIKLSNDQNPKVLDMYFTDIDFKCLSLSEWLLEKPESLINRTKKALGLLSILEDVPIDNIRIKFHDLPSEFNVIDPKYRTI